MAGNDNQKQQESTDKNSQKFKQLWSKITQEQNPFKRAELAKQKIGEISVLEYARIHNFTYAYEFIKSSMHLGQKQPDRKAPLPPNVSSTSDTQKLGSIFKNGAFNTSLDDWKAAEQYFNAHPDATKLPKKGSQRTCSFFKVDNTIYAIKPGKTAILGEGTYGRVKVAQTIDGNNFAVKVQQRGLKSEDAAELDIMKYLGELQGIVERSYKKEGRSSPKVDKYGYVVDTKSYLVMPLKKGTDLRKHLYRTGAPVTKSDKLVYAIKCIKNIQELHKKGIIHGDIKAANFMINEEEGVATLSAVDFGLSLRIKSGQTRAAGNNFSHSPETLYFAPELRNPERWRENHAWYSFKSDTYSLAYMLKTEFDIDMPNVFWDKALNDNPDLRYDTNELINMMTDKLSKIPDSERTKDANELLSLVDKGLKLFEEKIDNCRSFEELLEALKSVDFTIYASNNMELSVNLMMRFVQGCIDGSIDLSQAKTLTNQMPGSHLTYKSHFHLTSSHGIDKKINQLITAKLEERQKHNQTNIYPLDNESGNKRRQLRADMIKMKPNEIRSTLEKINTIQQLVSLGMGLRSDNSSANNKQTDESEKINTIIQLIAERKEQLNPNKRPSVGPAAIKSMSPKSSQKEPEPLQPKLRQRKDSKR